MHALGLSRPHWVHFQISYHARRARTHCANLKFFLQRLPDAQRASNVLDCIEHERAEYEYHFLMAKAFFKQRSNDETQA